MGRRLTDEEIAAAVRIGTDAARRIQPSTTAAVVTYAEPYSADDPFAYDWQAVVHELRGCGWSSFQIEAYLAVPSTTVRGLSCRGHQEPLARTGLALLWLLRQARDGLRPEHVNVSPKGKHRGH